jgi:hypothetical protein
MSVSAVCGSCGTSFRDRRRTELFMVTCTPQANALECGRVALVLKMTPDKISPSTIAASTPAVTRPASQPPNNILASRPPTIRDHFSV